MSPSSILTIAHNLFRQFLNVTFNEIFCILAFFLFYGTPAKSELFEVLARNRIWLQIQTEIQLTDSTESKQWCVVYEPIKKEG